MEPERRGESISLTVWTYAIVLGLTSVTLPVLDALCHKSDASKKGGYVEHEWFLEVFHLTQYASGLLCLFVLLMVIYCQTRNSCPSSYCCYSKRKTRAQAAKSKSRAPIRDSPILEQAGPSEEPRVILLKKKTGKAWTGKPSTHETTCSRHSIEAKESSSSRQAPLASLECPSVNVRRRSQILNDISGISLTAEGVNLYLRLGALGFGFGVMIYDGLKIADQLHMKEHDCGKSVLWMPKYGSHLLFIFMQTFFIVKHFSFKFTRCVQLVHFCLVHLIISNFGQWFKVVVYEISGGLISAEDEQKNSSAVTIRRVIRSAGGSSGGVDIEKQPCKGFSEMMAPYLFPCVIEYSLIACAICVRILEINLKSIKHHHHLNNNGMGAKRLSVLSIEKINKQYSECHKSHKGLFVGLFLFMATVVSMAIFFLFSKEFHTAVAFRIYQITETALLGISLLGAIIALHCIRKLRRYKYGVCSLDGGLLTFGFSGVVIYNILILVPAIPRALKGDLDGIVFMAMSLAEIFQCLMQFILIFESERRSARGPEDVRMKPGRTIITCLLITNLALWLINTFEVEYVIRESFQSGFYDKTSWSILTRILLPLLIFFRFHSTVCLSSAWTLVYKMRP